MCVWTRSPSCSREQRLADFEHRFGVESAKRGVTA